MNTNFGTTATSSIVIGAPKTEQIPALRTLWKEAFGDTDEFLDLFFGTAFHPKRCHCITLNKTVVAALYWFTCSYQHKPIAYIYAVATAKAYRGQGLCHKLLDYTHKHLSDEGYHGAILVPGSEELFRFYERMGYRTCSHHTIARYKTNFDTGISHPSCDIKRIDVIEFSKLRRLYLPTNAIIQENENLSFLESQADFYAGEDFILTATESKGTLLGIELLGNTDRIPEILETLGYKAGTFCMPPMEQVPYTTCETTPFAMYYSFANNDSETPFYFGFAFN